MSNTKPWVKFEEVSPNHGRFNVSPLNRGMGTTIGNALRRVLLSSLGGAAPTAVKIDGVTHEFDTIEHVVEDVLDIICNIKGLVFKSATDEEHTVKLTHKGKGSITGASLELPEGIALINPEHHIAQASKDVKINMEITVNSGIGYASAEANKTDDKDVQTIFIDASFSPIVRVNHQVESIRVGKELDYDGLALDVVTNGSSTAEEAVTAAAEILSGQIGLFQALNQEPVAAAEASTKEVCPNGDANKDALALKIDDLELSARSSNCLKRAGIETVEELMNKEFEELLKVKNFGKKSVEEINEKLSQYNLVLAAPEEMMA